MRERTQLKKQIETVFRHEGKKLESINYIFCSDDELLKINQQFLQHDFFTDIITFDLSETQLIKGEVYVSIDRVRENARNLSVPLSTEMRRVIFHGALHLCGYKDKSSAQKKRMRNKEDYYLAKSV